MAVGAAVAAEGRPALTVWFDGDCPICTAEIGLMRRLDRQSAVAFVDLRQAGGDLADREDRLARFHAQPSDGPMVSGAAAFVALWRTVPSLRPLALLASPPPVLWLLERAYRLFLRRRPWLQAVARRGR
jgi:predicted DCC family thiol-disulfide oxidoreductase YuxK